jgi:ribosome-binding protein aMBF1 (putative translation factor)
MPDFRFSGGNIYFSILSDPNGKWPLLVPRITNPNFLDTDTFKITGPPGIKELIEGDLGITELLMVKIMEPVFATLKVNTLISDFIANQPDPLEKLNQNSIPKVYKGEEAFEKARKKMLASCVPGSVYLQSGGEPSGLKSLEKTIITSMMESYKPLMDLVKILIEMMSIGEDAVCRYLGSSIKIAGKQIGIPSRNPKYWSKELKYAKTLTSSIKDFDDAISLANKEFNKSMSKNNPIKENVKSGDSTPDDATGTDNKDALYIGYFDEDGKYVEPPLWVKNSNKWLEIIDKDNNRIGAPFKQLSNNMNDGVSQIRAYHEKAINRIKLQKVAMIEEISKRATDINNHYDSIIKELNETKNLTKEDLAAELKRLVDKKTEDIKVLEEEKKQSSKEFDDVIQTIVDVIDGTNVAGNNYINDDNPLEGVNPPSVISEWIGKVRGSQLRQKYFPEAVSTIQTLVDRKGEGVEPYVFVPKYTTRYKGKLVQLEVPLLYDVQIRKEEFINKDLFFDTRLRKPRSKGGYTYSVRNVVDSIDLFYNTDSKKPYKDAAVTYFKNDIHDFYIPDNIKSYYLPIEWEEIKEYQIRYKSDPSKVIKTEVEVVPHKIDVENDYEIRVIKVINVPLLPPPGQSGLLEFFPSENDLLLMRSPNQIQFLDVTSNPVIENIELLDVVNRPVINNSLVLDKKLISSFKFKTTNRYVDETYYSANSYFYLRKENSKWGDEVLSRDSDDSEIFQVKLVDKTWISKTISITYNPRLGNVGDMLKQESGADFSQHIIIDDVNKTIKIHSSKISDLPRFILESKSKQFKILSGKNSNREIKITDWITVDDYSIFKYDGILISETISSTAEYDASGILSRFNTVEWNYQYAESSRVETFQEFTYERKFRAKIYPIRDINYVPEIFKKLPRAIVIQGMNENSILSTITDKNRRDGINLQKYDKPDLEVDGIFNISAMKTIKTDKGIFLKVLQVNEPIEKKFLNRAYSGNRNDNFYFPLRIVGLSNNSEELGDIISDSQITKTGTIYTYNHNIPENLIQQEDGTSPDGNLHSPLDINEKNTLKEGVVYQGLDPRFVHRSKYKVFWLVEALKKDDRGIAPINKKYNDRDLSDSIDDDKTIKNSDSVKKGGKVWYGLIDKYTALPILISKMVPILGGKLIPLIMKIIQLISNPSKIKDLLSDMITDKSISKLPINFPAFDKDKGTLNKVIKYKKIKLPKTFDDGNPVPKNPFYYAGPQIGNKNPKLVSLLDGKAVAEFGKGLNKEKKPLFSFGLNVEFAGTPPFKPIVKKKKQTDFNNPPEDKTQSLIELILNFIKMPFEIIFMIFKWVMNWVKKMLNPVKIPKAISEFMTFQWLKDIIGKKGLLQILGIDDPLESGKLKKGMDDIINANGKDAQKLFDDLIKSIAGGTPEYSEVLIYHLFRNGVFLKEEIVERPYNGSINDPNLKGNTSDRNRNNNLNGQTNDVGGFNLDLLSLCGPRFFKPNDLVPIPFWSDMPSYNMCELPQIFLKPLELILGTLKLIQELLNALISMPMAILGLDPQIPIPKFGKEIPFANVFDEMLQKIRDLLQQIKPI